MPIACLNAPRKRREIHSTDPSTICTLSAPPNPGSMRSIASMFTIADLLMRTNPSPSVDSNS